MAATAVLPERYNASLLVDRNLDAGRGDKVAFHAPDATLTYADLHAAVNRAGNALSELGVRREDRVLMVLDDTTAFPATFLGAMRIGAVPVPVSFLDKAANFRHFIEDSYARVVVAQAPLVPQLRELAGDPTIAFVSVGGPAEGAIEYADLVAGHSAELDPAPTHRDDMAFWLYSSGSTGLPKGVVHLHHDIDFTCETYAKQVIGLREDDITFSTTKLYHAYGLGNGLSFPLYVGGTSVLMQGPPKPGAIAATLEEHRPTVFFSVPALYAAMLRAEGEMAGALDSVRFCVSAAEALPPTTYDRWLDRYGVEIVDGIGSTEMLHIFCSNRPGEVDRGTTGRPVPGYDLRITDDDGAVLDGEAVGNLEVRGDSCAAFYWRQHEKTKSCMRGDWFFTGDRYRRTADGLYVYEGRSDDMLKIGGLWVSPIDMENALLEHPGVQSCGVIGTRVDDQSKIAAFVIASDGYAGDETLAEELRSLCKERLRRYEYPHIVTFVADLPVTVTGKVQRFKLRELALEGKVSASVPT